jgi:UDP-N-acetylmuramate--alanine ligase
MQHIHFIGIGGAGMSGLAEIALARGITVSGSDLSNSAKLKELKRLGASISIGHRASNISADVDVVVFSSAVSKIDNPEYTAALMRGIRLVRRAEFLGELTRSLQCVGVAGTHGKTTTTSMIAHVLLHAGLDPMISVGASVFELGGKNAHAGTGNLAIVEADEYDRSFLALQPYIAVLTTLEPEHLDIYRDLADLQDAFVQFSNGGSAHGMIVANIDEPALRTILPRLTKKIVTFGVRSEEAKYRAKNIVLDGLQSHCTIYRSGTPIGTLMLGVPGEHNIKNALAAIAVAESLAIPFEIAAEALETFRGAERRAQLIGEANGVLVIDDYAHHPTEIEATLSALRTGYPNRRIVAAFQPHTFTRTRDFAIQFGEVFAKWADALYLLDIYPAREKPIEGISSLLILNAAHKAGLKDACIISSLDELPAAIIGDASASDIVITLGAGTITSAAPQILKAIGSQSSKRTPERLPRRTAAVDSH